MVGVASRRVVALGCLLGLLGAGLVSGAVAAPATSTFTEDFTSVDHRDGARTTAMWSTSPPGAHLPEHPVLRGNLFATSLVEGRDLGVDQGATFALATGDLDGDGSLDVIVGVNGGRNRVHLGSDLLPPSDVAPDSHATRALRIADLDGDGHLDLVVGNYGQRDRIHLGVGDGTFGAGIDLSVDADWTQSVATGDVDGDGIVDVLTGTWGRNRLHRGNGDGTFQPPVDLSTHSEDTRAVELADLDGDGVTDAMVANFGAPTRWHRGNGNGTFAPGVILAQDDTTALVVVDLDGDGNLDLVLGNHGVSRALRSNGDGTYRSKNLPLGDDHGIVWGLAVTDLDGDGYLDIIAAQQGTNRYVRGTANDHFQLAVDLHADAHRSMAVAVGDLDGDGVVDVIIGNDRQRDRVYVDAGGADPFVGAAPPYDLSSDSLSTRSIAVGDLTDNGTVDVVTGTYSNTATNRFYEGNGAGGFHPGAPVTSDTHLTHEVLTADLDGDDILDVVVANWNQPNRFYRGLANGTFTAGSDTGPADKTYAIALADVDGDGHLDLVTGNADNNIGDPGEPNRVHHGDGTGTFGSGVNITADSHNTAAIAIGDVDGDGRVEVVAGNRGQPNRIYERRLVRGIWRWFGTDITADAHDTRAIALGDVDGDGNLDVVVGNFGARDRIHLGNGDGTFAAGTNVSNFQHQTSDLRLIDVDGDGHLDLLTSNYQQRARLHLGDGDGNFQPGTDISTDALQSLAIEATDLNGDGFVDVVVGNLAQPDRVRRGVRGRTVGHDLARDHIASTTVLGGRPFSAVTLDADVQRPRGTDVAFEVTNDGGARWYPVRPGGTVTFAAPGDDVRWRATLGSASRRHSPVIDAVTLTAVHAPLPDLRVTALADPPTTVEQGAAFTVTDSTRNRGAAPAAESRTRYYLSSDKVIDPTDRRLTGARIVPPLAAGATSSGSRSVTVPATTPTGNYWLFACADDLKVIVEEDETDNCRRAPGNRVQVTVPLPDLRVTALADPPATVAAGGTFTVTDTTSNRGGGTAEASRTRYWLTETKTLGSPSRLLSGVRHVPELAPGAADSGSRSVTVPTNAAAGRYWLMACADAPGLVTESDETNNCRWSATRVRIP